MPTKNRDLDLYWAARQMAPNPDVRLEAGEANVRARGCLWSMNHWLQPSFCVKAHALTHNPPHSKKGGSFRHQLRCLWSVFLVVFFSCGLQSSAAAEEAKTIPPGNSPSSEQRATNATFLPHTLFTKRHKGCAHADEVRDVTHGPRKTREGNQVRPRQQSILHQNRAGRRR